MKPKNSKLTKFSPNLLKFGLKVHHQVSCSANEALAKIWSLSFLLHRFSVLLVHAVSVVESLSRSYDVSMSVSMVFQSLCWLKYDGELEFCAFVSIENCGTDCGKLGCVDSGVLSSDNFPFGILTNVATMDNHLIVGVS